MKLEDRIVRSIKQRKGVVILRSELAPLGSPAQVGRVLSKLVGDGRLVRVSKGVFAKTRINKFTGKLAPGGTFESIVAETFRKLNVCVLPGQLVREHNVRGRPRPTGSTATDCWRCSGASTQASASGCCAGYFATIESKDQASLQSGALPHTHHRRTLLQSH